MDAIAPYLPKYPTPLPADSSSFKPLSEEFKEDGKSLINPPREDGRRSDHYEHVYKGADGAGGRPWWDFHIYYMPSNPNHIQHAKDLHEAVRREFPELRVYRFWDKPVGPHVCQTQCVIVGPTDAAKPTPMFEVNVFDPHQLGALLSFFVAKRGPCSVLIHPNTGDDVVDHTTHATWLGERMPLDVDILRAFESKASA
ncbi:hypothetical protein P7C73_g5858, partial [Tremellales sp. Uapishka_1]